ncbi:hypothetical protein DRQ50_10110 [bacterium]|nr:MAG: hypothetical protein DRQ50_10110 [bacterium]
MKRFPFILLLLITVLATVPSPHAAAGPNHAVSLQFLHSWSTSPDPETTSAVRISLLYGRSASVTWLDLGGAATRTSGTVRGLQGTLGYAGVGGDLRGLALTLGVHLVQQDVHGLQLTGLSNWVEGELRGGQYSFLLNRVGEGFRGAQVATILNQSDGDGRWVQLGGVANVNVGDFVGVQMAGIVNHANANLAGVQTGILNYANDVQGVQVGILNLGRTFKGVQIGIINKSYEFSGLPLGLVNLSESTQVTTMVYASNHAAATVGVRTVLNGWSSIVSVGYGDQLGDVNNSGFFGWHFGRRLLDRGIWRLTADIGFTHITPETSDDPAVRDKNHSAGQLRLHGEWRLGRTTALFAGVGASNVAESYDDGAASSEEFLVFGGLVLGGWH